jgi:hypothetical protein
MGDENFSFGVVATYWTVKMKEKIVLVEKSSLKKATQMKFSNIVNNLHVLSSRTTDMFRH